MAKKPSYKTILAQLQKDIASGLLTPGERLPSERDFAAQLGVHRSTVARALNALVDQGLVERRVGSGSYIANNKWGIQLPEKMGWHKQLHATETANWYDNLVSGAMERAPHDDWRRLDDGDAPTDWLPKGQATTLSWDTLFAEAAESDRLGLATLRDAVASYLKRHYDMIVDPREILITSGTQQSLFLITHGFLEPGDTIAIESPSYFYSLRLFQAAGLNLVPIPLDGQGPSLIHLEEAVQRGPIRMLFLNPIFQNPTGIVTSPTRKKEIIAYCSQHHIPIFEDDASSMLAFQSHTDTKPMKAADPFQQILYAGSISKYMGPSVRLGWLIGPAKLMEALAELRQDMDANLSILPQLIVRDYLNNDIDQQIKRLITYCKPKLSSTLNFMNTLSNDLRPLSMRGGFYLYYRLTNTHERLFRSLLLQLLQERIIIRTGDYFGENQLGMRLNITRF